MLSILAIDDDPGILRALKTVLEPSPTDALDALAVVVLDDAPTNAPQFCVKTCTSGEAGVAWLRQQVLLGTEPGVAIVDMRMPGGWDGMRTMRELWAVSPELQIVICTAYSDYTWEDLLASFGATDSMLVLKKPFDRLEVRQAALALGQKWQLNRERAALHRALSQAQRLEAIGRIAGGVAHDLNNMLMVLVGEVAILTVEVGERQELQHIQEMIARTQEMTRTLLLFSQARQDVKKTTVSGEMIHVGALITSSLPLLRRLVPSRIRLQIDTAHDEEAVQMTAVELHRVLLNLILNAVDATPDRGVIALTTQWREEQTEAGAQRWLTLTISDQGEGMSEGVRRRLFEPFFSTKSPEKGTGLGLAIVQDVIARRGGSIAVHSAVGEGTRFDIRLPAASYLSSP
jgi:two-component system, NtrC family, sensor kinase